MHTVEAKANAKKHTKAISSTHFMIAVSDAVLVKKMNSAPQKYLLSIMLYPDQGPIILKTAIKWKRIN